MTELTNISDKDDDSKTQAQVVMRIGRFCYLNFPPFHNSSIQWLSGSFCLIGVLHCDETETLGESKRELSAISPINSTTTAKLTTVYSRVGRKATVMPLTVMIREFRLGNWVLHAWTIPKALLCYAFHNLSGSKSFENEIMVPKRFQAGKDYFHKSQNFVFSSSGGAAQSHLAGPDCCAKFSTQLS